MTLFNKKYGLIVACDVNNFSTLEMLARDLGDLNFITGFKIGMHLTLKSGLFKTVEAVKEHTQKPIIYDHQKYGTDIPDVCGGEILKMIRKAGVDGLIIFPQSGIETLKATVKGCRKYGLTPIVGGVMTHKGFLVNEGGYIDDQATERIYMDAAKLMVKYYILPGNRIELMKKFKENILRFVSEPKILFPGVGLGQKGDIRVAFQTTLPVPSYAIVGRSIYRSNNVKEAAENIWKEAEGVIY